MKAAMKPSSRSAHRTPPRSPSPSRARLARLVLAGLLVALPTLAQPQPADATAPPGQYEPYVREATEIHDLKTTLTWERAVSTVPSTYAAAESGCAVNFSGFLPTVKELLTIVNERPHQEYAGKSIVDKMIDGQAFPNTPVDKPYWTSTDAGSGMKWAVHFDTGTLQAVDPASPAAYVRCVR
jgi:hypothetical protein